MMKKRQIIVNRKFQINIAGSFAAVSAATMTIIIIILSSVLIYNNIKLEEIAQNQRTLCSNQEEIFKTLTALSASKNLANFHISSANIQEDDYNTKLVFNQNNDRIQDIAERNVIIIIMLIASAVFQTGLVFILMLKRSHRISGPVFLLNRYIDDMKKGIHPDIRPLRINDDFQDLFENFRELADKIRSEKL